MKKYIGLLLCFCLCLAGMPVVLAAEQPEPSVTVEGRGRFVVTGTAAEDQLVSVLVYRELLSPDTTVCMDTVRTGDDGSYRVTFQMPSRAARGEYTLALQQPDGEMVTKTIFYAGKQENLPWWQQFPRLSKSGYAETKGNVLISGNAGWDAGQGLFYLENELKSPSRVAWRDKVDAEGVHRVAWIEGMGDTRVIGGAVHKNDDGSYALNAITGAANIVANPWNWNANGPAANSYANETVWFSAASMVNKEPWQGAYGWPDELAQPTYPDGTSAVGYIGGDKTDPRKAKLYDAAAQKDINGNLTISEPSYIASGQDTSGSIRIGGGSTRLFYFSKDAACPWWQSYARLGIRRLIDDGVSGFWVDNYNGWNDMGAWPVTTGFGDWTVAGFRTYLTNHPEVGVADSAKFDIRAYLKAKLAEWYPGTDTSNVYHSGWQDARWHDEPVWNAFCAYKADVAAEAMKAVHTIVKEEAAKAGKDPDSIVVLGNDIGKFTMGSERDYMLDMVSTEYQPDTNYPFYGSATADGLPDKGHSAASYKVYAALSEAARATVWIYLNAACQDNNELAKVFGYEALANNTTVYTGLAGDRLPGGAESTLAVNSAVTAVADVFAGRTPAGSVAVLYSPQSDGFYLKPRLTEGEPDNPHRMGYSGFAYALEDASVPYVVIPDFALTVERLQGVDTLILPNVISIDEALVKQVIQPFAADGGKLIITGEESGIRDVSANGWAKRSSAILADLRSDPACAGRVFYEPGCPGEDYYRTANGEKWSGPQPVLNHPDYTASKPTFTKENGKVSAAVTVTCNLEAGGHADAFLAAYSGGRLTTVRTVGADIASGASKTLQIDAIPAADTFRLFVWNGLMQPIMVSSNGEEIPSDGLIGLLNRAEIKNRFVFDGFGAHTQATVNQTEDALFFDVVNKNINIGSDVVTPDSGGVIRVSGLSGERFVCCRVFDEKTNAFADVPFTASNGTVEISVPAFRYYTSVVLYRE